MFHENLSYFLGAIMLVFSDDRTRNGDGLSREAEDAIETLKSLEMKTSKFPKWKWRTNQNCINTFVCSMVR